MKNSGKRNFSFLHCKTVNDFNVMGKKTLHKGLEKEHFLISKVSTLVLFCNIPSSNKDSKESDFVIESICNSGGSSFHYKMSRLRVLISWMAGTLGSGATSSSQSSISSFVKKGS